MWLSGRTLALNARGPEFDSQHLGEKKGKKNSSHFCHVTFFQVFPSNLFVELILASMASIITTLAASQSWFPWGRTPAGSGVLTVGPQQVVLF